MKPKPKYDYPVNDLIQKRWSPRAFADKVLSEEQILTLFEAARWAASCNNEQPWRFIWSLKDGSDKYNKLSYCLTDRNREWVSTAPLLILNLIQTSFSSSGKPNKWAMHDLGLAIGNLTTQATAMDLYVHNMAGFSVEKVHEVFTLPSGLEPVTMIAAGYLGEPSKLSEFNQKREMEIQARKPLSELFLK